MNLPPVNKGTQILPEAVFKVSASLVTGVFFQEGRERTMFSCNRNDILWERSWPPAYCNILNEEYKLVDAKLSVRIDCKTIICRLKPVLGLGISTDPMLDNF